MKLIITLILILVIIGIILIAFFCIRKKSPRYVAGIVWHSRYHAGGGTDETGICNDAKIGLFHDLASAAKDQRGFSGF